MNKENFNICFNCNQISYKYIHEDKIVHWGCSIPRFDFDKENPLYTCKIGKELTYIDWEFSSSNKIPTQCPFFLEHLILEENGIIIK